MQIQVLSDPLKMRDTVALQSAERGVVSALCTPLSPCHASGGTWLCATVPLCRQRQCHRHEGCHMPAEPHAPCKGAGEKLRHRLRDAHNEGQMHRGAQCAGRKAIARRSCSSHAVIKVRKVDSSSTSLVVIHGCSITCSCNAWGSGSCALLAAQQRAFNTPCCGKIAVISCC